MHEALRIVNLRLPKIGYLMEILKEKDDLDFKDTANTISEARKALNEWKRTKTI